MLHEFRALVLFALQRYSEAAGAIHAVLAVGPGWDAMTLTSLYSNMATYTGHLRAAEAFRNAHPKAADVRLVIGYHYLTCGYPNEAADEFRRASKLQPKDAVAGSLAATLTRREPTTSAPAEQAVPQAIAAEAVVGGWTAAGGRAS